MNPSPRCSIVIPVYEEGELLWNNGRKLASLFDAILGKGQWDFVIVENGSRDDTLEVAQRLCLEFPQSKIVRLSTPDYGQALRSGMEATDAPFASIINIEQWDMPFLNWAWHIRDQYDLFLGSKRADPTLNGQSQYRKLLSWGLNSVLGFLFECTASDTHGPKFVHMDALRPIIAQCRMTRGQFDTEMTLRAIRAGLRIAEAPVAYLEERPARDPMVRKIAQNVLDLWDLRRHMAEVPYIDTICLRRYCRKDLVSLPRPEGLANDLDPRAYW